jgi:hypothetical protein
MVTDIDRLKCDVRHNIAVNNLLHIIEVNNLMVTDIERHVVGHKMKLM